MLWQLRKIAASPQVLVSVKSGTHTDSMILSCVSVSDHFHTTNVSPYKIQQIKTDIRVVILSNNSHHSSLRPFCVAADSAVLAAIPICCELQVHTFQFNVQQYVRLLRTVFTEGSRGDFLQHTSITANKCGVHGMLALYTVSKPLGRD